MSRSEFRLVRRRVGSRAGALRWLAGGLVLALLAGACASDTEGEASDAENDESTTEDVVIEDPMRVATVSGPIEGGTINLPQPAAPLPDGFVEEEYFLSGEATSYSSLETPDDGMWVVEPDEEPAEYATRIIVRRPENAADFSGTVIVEWFNVSALEASPDWAYTAQEIGRRGHAYVGVSAQLQGVMGGETILDVEVDQGAADAAGATGTADGSGLVNIDPDRYGTLQHPGDRYAYDIYSQVGRALRDDGDAMLGGASAQRIIAIGESQSAYFMTTYVNAVHPLASVYDGFIVHSRGGGAAPIDGEFGEARADRADDLETGVTIRTDLDEPVFVFESETDLTLLGFGIARQPDTDTIRTWEVAGTAHTDAHLFRVFVGGPRDAGLGSIIGCDAPINTGPHHEVLQAALSHMVGWVDGGDAPPPATPLETASDDTTVLVRDELGIVRGGVRNPLVDVPVVVTTGDPADPPTGGDFGLCDLFGSTTAIDQATLLELHGSFDMYLEAFGASTAAAVEAGVLLQEDADELLAEAASNAALFG